MNSTNLLLHPAYEVVLTHTKARSLTEIGTLIFDISSPLPIIHAAYIVFVDQMNQLPCVCELAKGAIQAYLLKLVLLRQREAKIMYALVTNN